MTSMAICCMRTTAHDVIIKEKAATPHGLQPL